MSIGQILWPFLIYWVVLFVICYIVVEFAQNYLYDEATPNFGLKVAGGAVVLAAMLTWTRSSFDTMLTSDIPHTVLQAIVWFAVFTLIFRFHPQHAVMIGVVTMLLVAGLASLAVDSLTNPARETLPKFRQPSKPVRSPAGPPITPAPKAAPDAGG